MKHNETSDNKELKHSNYSITECEYFPGQCSTYSVEPVVRADLKEPDTTQV